MDVDPDLKQNTDDIKPQEVNPVYIINTIRKAILNTKQNTQKQI